MRIVELARSREVAIIALRGQSLPPGFDWQSLPLDPLSTEKMKKIARKGWAGQTVKIATDTKLYLMHNSRLFAERGCTSFGSGSTFASKRHARVNSTLT
jgi:hypothetical protein